MPTSSEVGGTRELMAILVWVGDSILWGFPDPEVVTVTKIHNSDPVAGKLRIKTTGPEIKISCRSPIQVLVKEPNS